MVLDVLSCLSLFLFMLTVALSNAGNVAVGKPTNQTGAWNAMTSERAVDGAYYDGTPDHCAAPEIPIGRPAAWWVQLERLHVIKSVTVYNTGDPQDYKRLNNFTLGVTNPGQHPVSCGRYVGTLGPGAHVTLTCPHNTVGNHVAFSRDGASPQPYYVVICEVEVNARVYDGCPLGFYGTNCSQRCGQCANSLEVYNPCDKSTGRCLNGCQVGWTEYGCRHQLAAVNKRSIMVPWLLFAISCAVLMVLGGTMVYSRKYNQDPIPRSLITDHSRRRYVNNSHEQATDPYRDLDMELEPALSKDVLDGPPYRRI